MVIERTMKSHRKELQWQQSRVVQWTIAFLLGYLCSSIRNHKSSLSPSSIPVVLVHPIITHTSDLPTRSTSHKDDNGQPITKKQLVEPFSLSNYFPGLSIATLRPGQAVASHSHENMTELFYIVSGNGTLQMLNQESSLSAGSFLQVPPKVSHGLYVSRTATEPMVMVVSGIITPTTQTV